MCNILQRVCFNSIIYRWLLCGILLLVTTFFVSSACAAEHTAKKTVVPIQHWKTNNGVSVYFVRTPELPMLDLRVVFAAGSVYDGKHFGTASLVASLLDEGAAEWDANKIANRFDRVGAQFSASVNRDMTVVALRTLTEAKYLNSALTTFINVLTKPTFPNKAIVRIKRNTLAAIQYGEQQPGTVASNAFYQKVFHGTAYAHPTIGTAKTIPLLTKAMVLQFYQHFYVADNAQVVIVGDLTRKQAELIANKITANLPRGRKAPKMHLVAPLRVAQSQHIQFPSKQTSIMLGQVGITQHSPDYFPLVVGSFILGGTDTSVLFKQVRSQRGLAYAVFSYFEPLRYRGPYVISLQTRNNKAEEALTLVNRLLKQFVDKGPTQAQLLAAKQNLIGSFPLNLASNSSIIAIVTRMAFYHLSLHYLDKYRSRIRAVAQQQIKTAFHRLIHLQHLVTVTVGPTPVVIKRLS